MIPSMLNGYVPVFTLLHNYGNEGRTSMGAGTSTDKISWAGGPQLSLFSTHLAQSIK